MKAISNKFNVFLFIGTSISGTARQIKLLLNGFDVERRKSFLFSLCEPCKNVLDLLGLICLCFLISPWLDIFPTN